jgi:hypothetical protein
MENLIGIDIGYVYCVNLSVRLEFRADGDMA